MKRKFIRTKKARFGGVSALLCIMVLVVAILVNVVVSAVVERYLLYTPMIDQIAFDVTEDCYALLQNVFDAATPKGGEAPVVRILFCDTEQNVKADTSNNYYFYHTVKQIEERFDNVRVECYDIFANPEPVKPYMTMENPLTGESIETELYTDSVIVVCGDYYKVYASNSFYVYSASDPENAWAYAGEKKLTAAMMHAVAPNRHVAALLNNHGEVFFDYELLNLLNDAGYTVLYLDLYQDKIPENCDLLISYNPNTDLLTGEQLSDVSEMDILDEFLAKDGNSFLVFLENGTPKLPNFEKYLGEWGVETDYAKNETTGVSYRYMVQDASGALTSDGYTIYGTSASANAEAFTNAPANPYVVFRNATSLSVTNEGYRDSGNGTYTSMNGKRTLYPLYRSSKNAQCFANGLAVDGGSSILMSVTEQKNESGGTSHVGVVSSVHFVTDKYLQSAVYGNSDVMLHLFGRIGLGTTTEGLNVKPFLVQDISTVTTTEILVWTLTLSIVPAVLALLAGVVILVKHRRA